MLGIRILQSWLGSLDSSTEGLVTFSICEGRTQSASRKQREKKAGDGRTRKTTLNGSAKWSVFLAVLYFLLVCDVVPPLAAGGGGGGGTA